MVKKTRATLVNRTIPAAAVAEWRGRVEDMAEDVERLVLVRLPVINSLCNFLAAAWRELPRVEIGAADEDRLQQLHVM